LPREPQRPDPPATVPAGPNPLPLTSQRHDNFR
jgi:hypothetical protein